MAYNHFDYVPSSVSHNRSVFKFEKAIETGAEIGYLYPMCAPVRMLPGSSLKLDLAMEVRSGALIAPLADEIIVDCFAFKVPNRIVWEHWKQFLGSTDDVLFDNLTDYQIPSFEYIGLHNNESLSKIYVFSHLLATCFELPPFDYRNPDDGEPVLINALPFRGYNFIWNEFFRPEQLVDPILFSKTDQGWTGYNMDYNDISINFNGSTLNLICPAAGSNNTANVPGGVVLPTFRVHKSLWTSCLPKPNLETVNLLAGLTAPVGIYNGSPNAIPSGSVNIETAGIASGAFGPAYVNASFPFNTMEYKADLSQAILTVNNYRETIMLDNYYNALNRAGSRYDELLRCLFHVVAPEAIIDIPELIVHKRFSVYRKDVIATAETLNSSNAVVTPLGTQVSYIDTVVRDSFFTTSTSEHGFVHMLYTIRPSRIRMGQGIEPMWTQLGKFDQYYPQFDGMGDVPRYSKEVFLDPSTPTSGDLTDILGYQEFGAEYKYQRNSAIGWCNPNIANHIAGLTLCEKMSYQPSLVPSNIVGIGSYVSCVVEEEAFARCLAVSNPTVAPQFILDIRLTGEIVHPMPVYNIPGNGLLL